MQKKILQRLMTISFLCIVLATAALYIIQTMIAHNTNDRTLYTAIFLGFMVLLFGIFSATVNSYIRNKVVRGISDTIKIFDEVAGGNLDVLADMRYTDEFIRLSVGINHMLANLKDRNVHAERSRRFDAVISSAGAGVVIKDENGLITDWNAGAERILGYSPKETIGKPAKFFSLPEEHAYLDETQEQLKNGHLITRAEEIRIHKNGTRVDCTASHTPVFNDTGEFLGSVVVFHDITDIKAANEKAQKLAAIVAIADAGIIVKDKNGVVQEWNIGAENILGYKPEEIIGHTTKFYAPEEGHAAIDKVEERLKRGEHTAHVEVVRKHKAGRLIDCSASYTPIFGDTGEFIGSVAIFHDISYKKQIEHALTEALERAEEASKAKSIFLANMSHEIRTPMNGVIGFTELALDEGDLSDTIQDYLNKIRTSAEILLFIINDILDISKIEAGAMQLEKIPFDLHDLFKDCKAVSSPKASEKGINLYFYAEPPAGKMLLGDPTRLRQILLNLLSNAIKFTNSGIVKLTAVIEEQKYNLVNIHIEVMDSGIGMTPKQIETIFDPFVQADNSTTRKYGGTGLGLSITKSFIELMGGNLELESRPGIGSRFGFTLPFETVPLIKSDSPKAETPSILQKPVFTGEVLVCEDNPINQDVIQEHLSRVGLTSIIAENGQQGVDAVKARMENKKPFDLILMDIHMPVMDGMEAMERLIELGNKTPVIALTANAMTTDKEKYLKCGMSGYLSKPFTTQELWVCLTGHLLPIHLPLYNETKGGNHTLVQSVNSRKSTANKVLNEKAGIDNSDGDEKFYKHLQKSFYINNISTLNKFRTSLRENDMKLAHRIAHTLKGASNLIGAEKLAKAAERIELTLSNGQTDCPPEWIEALEARMAEVLTFLAPLLAESTPALEPTAETFDKDKALTLIEKLSPLLRSGNPESTEFTDEVKMTFSPLGEISDMLVAQIEDYDFHVAFETIRNIKEQVESNDLSV